MVEEAIIYSASVVEREMHIA